MADSRVMVVGRKTELVSKIMQLLYCEYKTDISKACCGEVNCGGAVQRGIVERGVVERHLVERL